jgi:ABC-2 type transport system permease protein
MIMPLFFASNSLYPLAIMPAYVAVLAAFNPLSYMVDAIRTLMVTGSQTHFGVPLDLLVLVVVDIVLIQVAARLYPRVVQ